MLPHSQQHTYIHTYIHTYTHTYIHTYIHTCFPHKADVKQHTISCCLFMFYSSMHINTMTLMMMTHYTIVTSPGHVTT